MKRSKEISTSTALMKERYSWQVKNKNTKKMKNANLR